MLVSTRRSGLSDLGFLAFAGSSTLAFLLLDLFGVFVAFFALVLPETDCLSLSTAAAFFGAFGVLAVLAPFAAPRGVFFAFAGQMKLHSTPCLQAGPQAAALTTAQTYPCHLAPIGLVG